MKNIALILPHQLFENHPLINKDYTMLMVEHPRYFSDFAFHKQKLMFHRASMQAYLSQLKKKKYQVTYVEYHEFEKKFNALITGHALHIIDPIDHILSTQLQKVAKAHKSTITWYDSPMFLTTTEWIAKNMGSKKKYLMHSFYVQQRKRLNILVHNGKPAGGKWNFDSENQERIPKQISIPCFKKPTSNAILKEAQAYVQTYFKNNPGTDDLCLYATTTKQAQQQFNDFLKHRFALFGIYQDAIKKDEPFMFHSLLSSALNTGLLTPNYVIEKAIAFAKNNDVPLNSLEGFIRQIIGWREFVRALYFLIGEQQRNSNFFNHDYKLPKSFYDGTTGIDPVDSTIKKLLSTGYSHHIERLMILGNYLLLSRTRPHDVYRWFMEMYIDSYDWVMVPNVYGMSQYASPTMTTKPYISSSNYILKMSDYQKGSWCKQWDNLFWTFIKTHEKKLIEIPRMYFMIQALHKKK